jgi:hypothetical protein
MLSMIEDVARRWDQIQSGRFPFTKACMTKVVVDSLKTMQFMSPTDVCTISAIYHYVNLRAPTHGIDECLIGTFEEFLRRAEQVFATSLSLPDLLDLYVEILHVTSAHPGLRQKNDAIQEALANRLRTHTYVPLSVKLKRLVDAVGSKIDEQILNVLSGVALSRIEALGRNKVLVSDETSDDMVYDLLALDEVFNQMGRQPSRDFVEAVRRFIC